MAVIGKGTKSFATKLLDMSSAARRGRAEDMGFDTSKVWYHGTPEQELEEFSLNKVGSRFPASFGVHLTSSKPEAEHYGSMGGTVGSYVTRAENPLIIDIPQGGNYSTASMKADLDKSEIQRQIREEAERGNIHDSVLIRKQMSEDWQDWGEVNENLIMLDPEKIRSTRAAFDPAQRESSNLLAGIGVPAVAATGLLNPQNKIDGFPADAGSNLLAPEGAIPYQEAQAPNAGWAMPAAQGIRSGLEMIPPHIRPFIPGEGVADWLEKGAYDELGWWDHVKAGLDFL